MAISFQNQNVRFRLNNKTKIKTWIKNTIESTKKQAGELNFVFTNDEELLEVNRNFLQHNTYTDIITFDTCEGNVINGDIIISIERVAENAQKFEVDFEVELHRVIIHGVLHLLGYKDKSKVDAALMRKMENWALGKIKT